MNQDKIRSHWRITFWILLILWILGAALSMNRINGGVLTDYLADLAFPPWFYIYIRGYSSKRGNIPKLVLVGTWFGQSSERASISIFLVGMLAEFKTLFWPGGPITGTYDPIDILAYATGLFLCYVFDKRTNWK
jgi:hypothetical protein